MVSPLPPSAAALRQSATRLGAQLAERMTPRQRQFALLGVIVAAGVGLLWLIFASTDTSSSSGARKPAAGAPGPVTNIGVMPPGQQVNPVDQWVGTAGSKLAQYESEREEQTRLNRDRQAFEARTMQRFAELEQRLTSATQAAQGAAAPAPATAPVRPCLDRSHPPCRRSRPARRRPGCRRRPACRSLRPTARAQPADSCRRACRGCRRPTPHWRRRPSAASRWSIAACKASPARAAAHRNVPAHRQPSLGRCRPGCR